MKSLLELYAPMLEAGNRQMKLSDFPEDAQVEWDRISQEKGLRHASFIERGGRYYANAKGGGWHEWDGKTWRPAEKPGPNVGADVGRKFTIYQGQPWGTPSNELPREELLWNVFSKDFTSYRNNLERTAKRAYGPDWGDVIETVYGQGAVNTLLSQLWRNFWTDHEAISEIGHYFDVAQQAVRNQQVPANSPQRRGRAGWGSDTGYVVGYPLRIGPRYDIAKDDEETWDNFPPHPGHRGDEYMADMDMHIRSKRITDASYFENIYSNA